MFAVALDPDFARVAGLRVQLYNLLVAVLAAVTVTVAMRTVGLLLVSALRWWPVATAQQLSRSFRGTLALAMSLGLVAAVGGLTLAAWLAALRRHRRPRPSIVLLSSQASPPPGRPAYSRGAGSGWAPRSRRSRPIRDGWARSTRTSMAPTAGTGRAHGDHFDYVHDGHRHAPHGSHYDEH
ncbi:MAG: metal ABC transporter permease [Nocardioides sp.]